MKIKLTLLICSIFVLACSSSKTTQKAINIGDYDKAIRIAVSQLQKNKTRKGNQEYIYMLEEAYVKVTERDLNKIAFLEQDANPEYLEEIYQLYLNLDQRQNQIKPLLPLYKQEVNKQAEFEFKNYRSELIASKNAVSQYLYEIALISIQSLSLIHI